MEGEIDESASLTLRRMDKGSHDFMVKNYSLHKGIGVGVAVESEEFVVGGHRWKVCFYPDGIVKAAYYSGNASLLISLVSDPPNTYVNCLYDLYILDQSGKGNHKGISLIQQGSNPTIGLKKGDFCGDRYLMKLADLESPDYLKDDCLKISCTIGVSNSYIQNLPVIKVPKSNLVPDWGKLLESNIWADVFFKVDNEIFSAHRFILAAHSPQFLSASSSDSQEIVIPYMEPRVFKAILRFIYTGNIQEEATNDPGWYMPESFLGKMLAAADRFELKLLKRMCESRILERISEESVAYLLDLADRCNATELKAGCLRFAAENEDAVMQSDGCEYLRRYCPSLFFELAGSKKKAILHILKKELDVCSELLCFSEDSLFGMKWPWNASHQKHKLKEA
ncbi:hypothetical protein ACP275_09G003100 [Erythranthe tilingii]